jgi:hypothetical protein
MWIKLGASGADVRLVVRCELRVASKRPFGHDQPLRVIQQLPARLPPVLQLHEVHPALAGLSLAHAGLRPAQAGRDILLGQSGAACGLQGFGGEGDSESVLHGAPVGR